MGGKSGVAATLTGCSVRQELLATLDWLVYVRLIGVLRCTCLFLATSPALGLPPGMLLLFIVACPPSTDLSRRVTIVVRAASGNAEQLTPSNRRPSRVSYSSSGTMVDALIFLLMYKGPFHGRVLSFHLYCMYGH